MVADRVLRELDEIGLAWDEDAAGSVVGSTMGNIICRLPGRESEGSPIFLCAHLDTVPPAGPIDPVVEEGVVRNAAGTILGADDKAAVAVMLEAARRIVAENRPHAGIELLFTPKEEVGLLGAYAFDRTRLEARLGYVYDQAAPPVAVQVQRAVLRQYGHQFAEALVDLDAAVLAEPDNAEAWSCWRQSTWCAPTMPRPGAGALAWHP